MNINEKIEKIMGGWGVGSRIQDIGSDADVDSVDVAGNVSCTNNSDICSYRNAMAAQAIGLPTPLPPGTAIDTKQNLMIYTTFKPFPFWESFGHSITGHPTPDCEEYNQRVSGNKNFCETYTGGQLDSHRTAIYYTGYDIKFFNPFDTVGSIYYMNRLYTAGFFNWRPPTYSELKSVTGINSLTSQASATKWMLANGMPNITGEECFRFPYKTFSNPGNMSAATPIQYLKTCNTGDGGKWGVVALESTRIFEEVDIIMVRDLVASEVYY